MRNRELSLYFKIVKDLADAEQQGADPKPFIEEMEAIVMHTDNDLLRRRCRMRLAEYGRAADPLKTGEAKA